MNPLTTLPAGLIALLVPLLLLCLACLIWAILPRRAPSSSDSRDSDIEQQIATLRKSADHAVKTRPRVRANGCSQPPVTHIKAAPKVVALHQACSGGICRHQANCADRHCPGRLDAMLATLP